MNAHGCPEHDLLLRRLHAHGPGALDEEERATASFAIETCDACAAVVEAALDGLASFPALPAANGQSWWPGEPETLRLTAAVTTAEVPGSRGGGVPTLIEAGDPVSIDLDVLRRRHLSHAPSAHCRVDTFVAEGEHWLPLDTDERADSGALVVRPPEPGRYYLVTFSAAGRVVYYTIETRPGARP